MKKLSNTDAELKKTLLIKKACTLLGKKIIKTSFKVGLSTVNMQFVLRLYAPSGNSREISYCFHISFASKVFSAILSRNLT